MQVKMSQELVVILLIFFNCFEHTVVNAGLPEQIMNTISSTLLGQHPHGQAAIAYFKLSDNTDLPNIQFGGFPKNDYVVEDQEQRYIAAKPKKGNDAGAAGGAVGGAPPPMEHAEKLIMDKLPQMITTFLGNRGLQVDVFLFSLNSPCCSPGMISVIDMTYYHECTKLSCSGRISEFIKNMKKNSLLQNIYISWRFPYVATAGSDSRLPAFSIMYYRNYFHAIRELLSRKVILILNVPEGKQWFQTVLSKCLIASLKLPDLIKARYKLANQVTANCAVDVRRKGKKDTGALNSFLDFECWKNVIDEKKGFQNLKLENYGKLQQCHGEAKARDDLILGPPLDPASIPGEESVSSNVDDLKF